MNRLKSVTEPDGTKEVYTFDGQGNIQTKTMTHPDGYEYTFKQNGKEYTLNDVATHEITYSYDANNRLKFEGEYIGGSGEEYEGFDNNGNMLKRTRGGQVDEETELFEYNELNQLTKYTDVDGNSTTYKYNPDGMRTSKINNGVETKYYWDRGYISAESVNDEYTASNYIGANGIFARESAEEADYMLKNGHGDVTSLVSEGVKDKTYNYSAYGEEKNKEEGDSNPFRYSGEYVDEESGLIYLRNRYYDPSIGRFINEDPAKDGLNWYVYANNNPIMFVDPLGLAIRPLTEIAAERGLAVTWNGKSGAGWLVTVDGSTLTLNQQYENGDYSLYLNGTARSADELSLHVDDNKIYIEESLFNCAINDGSYVVDEGWMIYAASLSVAVGIKGGATVAKGISTAVPAASKQMHILQYRMQLKVLLM